MPRPGVANDGDLSNNRLILIGAWCGVEKLGAWIKAMGVKCHFMFIYRVTTLRAVFVFSGTYDYDKSKHMKLVVPAIRAVIEFLPSGSCG